MGEKDVTLEFKKQALELVQKSLEKTNRNSDLDWTDIKDSAPFFDHNSDLLRRYSRGWQFLQEWNLIDFSQLQLEEGTKPLYRETTEVLKDGTHKSDKLIKMNAQESKDEEYMLRAHGFDPNEWEIMSIKNSIYDANTKGGITKTFYSSKISAKKKKNAFNIENFLKKIENIKPRKIERPKTSTKRMLTVPFVDQHFGINNYKSYERKLQETIELFESKKWDTIYIPIGNDLLHNNDHKGNTANGTPIESVDMDYATEEALRFYTELYDSALANAVNVVSDYIPGNHDADITWMFVKMLSKQYPDIKWDTSMETKKLFRWENILLANLHGDKGLARVADALITTYRDFVVGAKTVEIHSGHLHVEKVINKSGIVVRTLPTDAATDQWHKDNTFEGATKISQIFEYNEDILKTIHLV